MDTREKASTSLLAKVKTRDSSALPEGDYDAGDILIKLEIMPSDKAMRKPWYARHEWPEIQRANLIISTIGGFSSSFAMCKQSALLC